MFSILYAAILLVVFGGKSHAQVTTEEPSEQALKSETIMLPYILKTPQHLMEAKQDLNKHFMLLTKNGVSDDNVDEQQNQQSLATKTHKLGVDWDRHSAYQHYPTTAHVYPWRLPHAYLHGSATCEPCYSAEPTNVVLFLNIGVLAYVLIAVVGLLNRLQHMSAGNMMQGNFDAGHIYYKHNENEDRSASWA